MQARQKESAIRERGKQLKKYWETSIREDYKQGRITKEQMVTAILDLYKK